MASVAVLLVSVVVGADPVAGIGPATARPVILRGGVLVLPLAAAQPGDRWPAKVILRFEDGESIDAEVAWMHAAAPPTARRWTDDPSGLAIRPMAPGDDSGNPVDGGAPYAVAALPMGRGGDFTVVDPRPSATGAASGTPNTPVRPIWIEPAAIASLAAPSDAPTLERRESNALPDPSSPFEHWRWTLVAQRRDMKPPPAPGDGLGAMVSRHGAEMWSIGLARLFGQSPGIAAACREALTQTCIDGEHALASWVTDPVETGALLAVLLDFNRRDRAVMDAALGWADSRSPLVLWIEQEQGGLVTIAAANGSPTPVEALATWTSFADALQRPDVGAGANRPYSRTVRAGELARLHVARPSQLPGPALARPDVRESPLVLAVDAGGHRRDVSVGPAVAAAEPPGLPLDVFRPPLRLAEARSGVQRAVEPTRATGGLLRRTQGRWELFIECARPPSAERRDADDGGGERDGCAQSSVLPIGCEAIVVALGPRDAPSVVLVVPEVGEPRLVEAEAAREARVALRTAERLRRSASTTAATPAATGDGSSPAGPPAPLRDDLEIVRRSLPSLWRCRIVMPAAWLPSREGETLLLGVARTHGGDGAVETSGLPQVPWDLWPSPTAIDLARWDE